MRSIPATLMTITILSIAQLSWSQASSDQNYVITNTVKQQGITTEIAVNSLPIATQGKGQTINYFDGLSRLIQKVITQGSAGQKDIVTGTEYDVYGREVKKYLPYADQNSTSYGGLKDRWNIDQQSFYNGILSNVDADNAPYSVSLMEASPLNRVMAQGAPGFTWQPNTTNAYDPYSHAVQFQYLINKTDDNVRIFNVDSSGNINTPGFYSTGLLNAKTTTDEQQQTVKEFTDKSGHVILRRVIIAGDSLQTYYLFDNLGMLRAVIQPEGTAILQAANWIIPTNLSKLWMFLYRYDERSRMVMKKVPGADSVLMFYDQWDRVSLTQDSNLRAGHNFLFTKYDALNRPVITGQINDTRTLDVIRSSLMTYTGRFETISTSATEGYTLTGNFPSSGSYTLINYTITHYDSYNNLPSWNSGYTYVNEYGISPYNSFLNGQVIATQTRVLGSSNFNRNVTFYDDKYRVIQNTNDNASGGKDRITKILSFDGKIVNDYHNHTSRFYTSPILTQQAYTYDHVDRLLITTHKTASQDSVIILHNTFNELGQIINKRLNQSPSNPSALFAFQRQVYNYNIRGWLLGINLPAANMTGYDPLEYFHEEMHYQNIGIPGGLQQFNGNISELLFKGAFDEIETGYTFQYDQANRLKSSAWGSNSGVGWQLGKRYDESGITYDHNGNLQTLTRYMGAWNKIDSLAYRNYNGNLLGKVDDLAGANVKFGFQDKDNGSGYDYTYDPNGNMISDYNKSIASITYNYLNLPNVVTITGKGTITYTYDAAGNKLQKSIFDQILNKTTNYYYAGDYVYRNDTLEFISHTEGRLRPVRIDTTQAISMANLKYIYDYFLKDHLGSVRCVVTSEKQTDIYAATMETANATKENALFSNISSTATAKPAGFSNDNNNLMASKLNGAVGTSGNKRVGPSIILKVMAGDTVSVSTYSWYSGAVQPAATGVSSIATELIPLLTVGVAGQNGGKGGAVPTSFTDPLLGSDISSLLSKDSTTYSNTRPKAFVNWMVVGEDYVAATSSINHVNAVQIPVCNAGDTMKQVVALNNMTILRNGWIYIYLSNESSQDVYFDNLVVNIKHGPLLEQKDYYPFGMENPVLSTQAIKRPYDQNRFKYNGIEYDTAFGLNEYEAHFRDLDPAICRWTTIDPEVEGSSENISPYASMSNNPVLKSDPLGNEDEACCGGIIEGVKNFAHDLYNTVIYDVKQVNIYVNPLTPFVEAAVGKSVESNFSENKSRIQSVTEASIVVFGGKIEEGLIKAGEKVLAKGLEEGATKGSANIIGRTGRQEKLMSTLTDPKASSADKGWIKQEVNQINRGTRKSIRNPPGKELAHERGREAAKGYSYKHSNLQTKDLHKLQHKYDSNGAANADRPFNEELLRSH